jgi:phosphohistidine phosphatase
MTKRLYLLRHAKAAPDSGEGDHERPLTGRGRRDAPDIGRELARRGYRPDMVLCSTSMRTTETLELVLPFFSPAPAVKLEPGLYHAEAKQILARAGMIEADIDAVLFVGHNPGLEDLALALAGESKIGRRIAEKFPTSAFAAFESKAATWSAAVKGEWTAIDFLKPAEL